MAAFPLLAPSFVVPFFVWLYSFLSTVVLVNLLIAQMSSTYDRVKENSADYWKFDRVQLVLEYKDNKDPFPPPLNVVYYLFRYASGDSATSYRDLRWPRIGAIARLPLTCTSAAARRARSFSRQRPRRRVWRLCNGSSGCTMA